MLIACKYSEVKQLTLNVLYEKIGHKRLSKEEIKRKESEILQAIDFDLSLPTTLDFI